MDGRPVDLARARREAKALLRAARGGDATARERMSSVPPGGPLRLSDAQLAIARELGARSWPALVRDAQARAVARGERARTFVEWATSARREEAEALLALDPDIAGQGLDAALVLGDIERVTTALAGDAGVVRRAFGARGWEPLPYVTSSAFLGGERTDALVACARLLLAAGADPDDGRSLRGAAGADDPACLELLLDAGARLVGAMALAHAAQRGRLRTARVLLERGPGEWGERENALQWAVHPEASAEMVRLLVEHGADLEASFDGSGRTPYGLAVRSGRPDLAELLADAGRAAPRRAARRADRRVPDRRRGDRASPRRRAPRRGAAAAQRRGGRPRPPGGRRPPRGRGDPARPRRARRCPRARGPHGAAGGDRVRGRGPRRPAPRARRRPGQASAARPPRRRRAALRRARLGGRAGLSAVARDLPARGVAAVRRWRGGRHRRALQRRERRRVQPPRPRRGRDDRRHAALARRARRPRAVAARRPRRAVRPARAPRRGRRPPRTHGRGHGRRPRPPGPRRSAAARARDRRGARRRRAARVGGASSSRPSRARARSRSSRASASARTRRCSIASRVATARSSARRASCCTARPCSASSSPSSRPSAAPGSGALWCRRARARRRRRVRASPWSGRRRTPWPSTGCWASRCAQGPATARTTCRCPRVTRREVALAGAP